MAPVPRWIRCGMILVVLTIVASTACSDDSGQASEDQRRLNSVIVGSYDELSAADSEAVSAIGLELVALAAPLQQWFDGTEDHAALLERMTAAVDRMASRLGSDPAPEVRATFQPYVDTWREILRALDADDLEAYDAAVQRVRDLDQIRIDRVVDVYGEEAAHQLLGAEGVDPNR